MRDERLTKTDRVLAGSSARRHAPKWDCGGEVIISGASVANHRFLFLWQLHSWPRFSVPGSALQFLESR